MIPKPIIIDISEWQDPRQINYDQLAANIDGVIVRVQYGSNYVDKHYQTHIKEFQKRNVPVAVYAWVRGTSKADMQQEAQDFYQRAQKFHPTFWWLDVEEQSMQDMRGGCEAYRKKLKDLGAKKVGVYVANHLYAQFNLATEKFDGVWLPTYGKNTGQYQGARPTTTNSYDIHQYTSKGKLNGYNGNLDLNQIVRRDLFYFFRQNHQIPDKENHKEVEDIEMKTITTTATKVKLRSSPKTGNNVIAELAKGTQIKINNIVFGDGFVWGVQPRRNGNKGYIDIGKSVAWVK
ncbi:hypothetical protein TH5N_08810 [Tetragenococcus halophilus]|uniref:GH25 family lysozyme n=1 Tax=Tetragenococcus halophilus TaxID=51669 RepID=UPI001928A71A|nr:GH25 family lysozyme [Tetragenococcus halophilus]GEQ37798.1 hypothetical protein TH3N_09240 [Tetragenococcus halophilus]GEQ40003.1 hypothetical protein TH5N_08810 [Tetragenococcus halophilus]GEQ42174.1 hypothetical protein TH6N_08000 [Tetragenococcus halophilus]GEQ44508.1 hypothetical protein TH8N_08780 [Tetragenococcus halophilus]GEQ46768.1 hypothetical protein TH9N_08810 [Tetragenococcus halophilus]